MSQTTLMIIAAHKQLLINKRGINSISTLAERQVIKGKELICHRTVNIPDVSMVAFPGEKDQEINSKLKCNNTIITNIKSFFHIRRTSGSRTAPTIIERYF